MLACYCACIVIILLYWSVCAFENKKKDAKYGIPGELNEESLSDLTSTFEDKTDKAQTEFRYTT